CMLCVVNAMAAMAAVVKPCLLLSLMLPAAAQRFASFDAATASSIYSSKTFGAELATTESSGYWCSAGNHEPGQTVSWTGTFRSRRQLLGLTLRWSYAPGEIKVLTSADGGNFQESVGWSKLSRSEPSFEDTVLFPEPVTAKAVKVLMRGAKPWGYFGLSNAVAMSGPSAYMLVSGAPAAQEQCLVAAGGGVEAKPCVDAIVAGTGAEVFSSSVEGQLQTLGGSCLGVVAGKVSLVECREGQGSWVVSQDGQVKQGNTCLVVAGSKVAAADCDDASSTGGDKFFQVAVPEHDPAAVLAVQEVGMLLRASVARQRSLVKSLQHLAPKLGSCRPVSLVASKTWPAFVQFGTVGSSAGRAALDESLPVKVADTFGPGRAALASVLAASSDTLKLVCFGFVFHKSGTDKLNRALLDLLANFDRPTSDQCGDSCAPAAALQPTGPVYQGSRRRRIDFAIQHAQLPAQTVAHHEGPSDHLVVAYTYDVAPLMRRGPRRRVIRSDVTKEQAAASFAEWSPVALQAALEDCDVETAWALLSDSAEDALCDPDECAVRRSEHWHPQAPSLTPKSSKRPERSPGLRALLRLHSRLQTAVASPHHRQLQQCIWKSLRGVRQLVPELPYFTVIDQAMLTVVSDLVTAYVDAERKTSKAQWRHRVRSDITAARSYIKKRTDAILQWEHEQASAMAPRTGRHPAVEVDRQAAIWHQTWRSRPGSRAALDPILAATPRPESTDAVFDITAAALKAATGTMHAKAPGPDSWPASALVLMPDSWWECAAALWRCVLQTGRIPRAWTRGRTSLLWKASGKSRPITVLPILWRAGAKLINEQLAGWCMSWRTARDTGGLPGTSVAAALQQLHFETQQGFRAVAQQDIASFFDSLEYGATEAILTHLKAPPELVRLFTNACAQSQRIFALEGALSKDWYRPTRGLPQGCPLSPLIAAAVTHVWACHVLGVEDQVDRPITGYGYVDDRVLLLRRHGSFQDLALAVERSNQFDRAMQLEVSLPKCAIIAEASCQEAAALARTLGYKHLQDLETLGVVVPQHGPWRLLKFSLRKLQVRLQLLRSLGLPNRTIGLLLRSLIVPCFTWAAAYAAPDAAELTAIRQEINHMTARFSTFGCARVLLHETIGWFLDPQFCLDVATLRAYWRSVVQPMDWTEALPLSELQGYVIKALPMLEPTLQRLQWALSADTKVLQCWDVEGSLRLLHVGYESFQVLLQWLRHHYRRLYVGRAGRVWRPNRRTDDDAAAVGLRLPPPSRDAQFAFGGHRECFRARAAGSDRELLLASIGAGASNWHYNAGGNFNSDHARHKCACGGTHPSRPHLAWSCTHFQAMRADIQPPAHTAQERLFAMEVGCYPAAPPAIDLQDFKEHLVELLGTFADEQDLFVATDGSSKDGVGSSGIAVQHPDSVAAFGDGLEDQSPYRMEVLALALALEAIDIGGVPRYGGAAIRAIQGEQGFDYALLLDTIRRYIKRGFATASWKSSLSGHRPMANSPPGHFMAACASRSSVLSMRLRTKRHRHRWNDVGRALAGMPMHNEHVMHNSHRDHAKAYRDYLHTLGTPSGEL
ncbi:unnamed protein product, partial [Symbiodinium sp. CCMP2592]